MILNDLETTRLILKCISEEDVDFIYQQFSDPEVNQFLFDAEPVKDYPEALDIVQMYTQQKRITAYRWIILLKSTNIKIGTLGFHFWNNEQGICEIGYDLQPAYWSKGYSKEAVSAMLDYLVPALKLRTVTATIYEMNFGSLALVKSLGFYDSLQRKTYLFHDQEYLHQIHRRDFQ
jgi:ribosomal-protein-alanine N-acetyltransferase